MRSTTTAAIPAACRFMARFPLLVAIQLNGKEIDLATATIPEPQQAYDAGLTSERVVEVYFQRPYGMRGTRIGVLRQLLGSEQLSY